MKTLLRWSPIREAVQYPRRAVRAAWSARLVALHTVAIVAGWALLTWGIARLLVPEVWLISAGLFCLSIAGWEHLRVLATVGLYTLGRSGKP